MSENINTTPLGDIERELAAVDDDRPVMVDVDRVSMVFNMASQQLNSLKEYAIALAKRELMFKEFRALDGVSFTVRKGDVFGILGTNGSGKSTMLKIIAGVLEPTEGTCTINGSIAPLIELGAGFDMELTARENIFLNGALLGYSKKFIQQHFDEIVDFAEVEKFLDMPMKNYSSGMVARIAFAIATVIVPEILIVDEVLSVGDFMFQQKCERRITQLIKEHDVTVLIVSHNNDQIERLCNKAIWIEKGHTRMMGSAADVCRAYRVLGGHVGSPESEAAVFSALNKRVKPDVSLIRSITADTRYGLASKLMSNCYPDGAKAVILVSGEREMDAFLATGLSDALDAPILLLRDGDIPDATAHEIKSLNPSEILFINSGGFEQGALGNALRHSLEDFQFTFDEIYGKDYESLSLSVFHYGNQRQLWGDSAVIVWVGCTGDLISLSPYIAKRRCPVFLKAQNSLFSEEQFAAVQSGNFGRIILLADEPQFSAAQELKLKKYCREVVRFVGRGPYHANELITDWVLSSNSVLGFGAETVYIASFIHAGFSLVLGPYVAKHGGMIMLCDTTNLDAFARSLARISAISPMRPHLVFIGGRGTYEELDIHLFAKMLRNGKDADT